MITWKWSRIIGIVTLSVIAGILLFGKIPFLGIGFNYSIGLSLQTILGFASIFLVWTFWKSLRRWGWQSWVPIIVAALNVGFLLPIAAELGFELTQELFVAKISTLLAFANIGAIAILWKKF